MRVLKSRLSGNWLFRLFIGVSLFGLIVVVLLLHLVFPGCSVNCLVYQIEGSTMLPTFEMGDHVVASPNDHPQRGDNIVFHSNRDGTIDIFDIYAMDFIEL